MIESRIDIHLKSVDLPNLKPVDLPNSFGYVKCLSVNGISMSINE